MRGGTTWLCWTALALHTANSASPGNRSACLQAERARAEELWHHGHGLLWFQHFRRAGGTSLCHLLRTAVPAARFLINRGEACQPEDWRLRDAAAVCEHNMSLIALELDILGGNAFAQEYGAVPGPEFLGHRARRHRMRDWVFVAIMREPWARFWSQLRYEMAQCLVGPSALARCVGGRFEELGHWWSPTAHPDSILGVPSAAISSSPAIYVDNYYTRLLLNRTDVHDGKKLTLADLYNAMDFVEYRASGVVILEDFANSALQLKCTLGLDLERARPMLRTHVRPYDSHEALLEVPAEESQLGPSNIKALRARFWQKNAFDYALYAHAKVVAKRRLAACRKLHAGVEDLLRNPPEYVEVRAPSPKAVAGDALPEQISVDDLFGCSGGSVEINDKGQYLLKCPRSIAQHADSWWSSEDAKLPKRKRGERYPGAECWHLGFSWSSCCAERFGPGGNSECWDGDYNYQKCCRR